MSSAGPEGGAPLPEPRVSVEQSVVIEGVTHRYRGGAVALRGLDLRIGRGLFGLLGPNGAGKSTLMRIICTLLAPSEGRVRALGRDVLRERRALRERLGYLPQEFSAWRLARVHEVLDTLARFSGMRESALRARRVEAVLAQVGLAEAATKRVKALSGGMRRRLGIAQALVHEPELLVVDEPTVGLDPAERLRFRQLMGSLARERVIILSTHIVADLGGGCRDLAILDRGELLFRGEPGALGEAARGRVFEGVIAVDGEARLPEDLEVVARTREGVGIRIRAVSASGRGFEGSAPVDAPTLEESYLAFMAERGRAAAVVGAGEGA